MTKLRFSNECKITKSKVDKNVPCLKRNRHLSGNFELIKADRNAQHFLENFTIQNNPLAAI